MTVKGLLPIRKSMWKDSILSRWERASNHEIVQTIIYTYKNLFTARTCVSLPSPKKIGHIISLVFSLCLRFRLIDKIMCLMFSVDCFSSIKKVRQRKIDQTKKWPISNSTFQPNKVNCRWSYNDTAHAQLNTHFIDIENFIKMRCNKSRNLYYN